MSGIDLQNEEEPAVFSVSKENYGWSFSRRNFILTAGAAAAGAALACGSLDETELTFTPLPTIPQTKTPSLTPAPTRTPFPTSTSAPTLDVEGELSLSRLTACQAGKAHDSSIRGLYTTSGGDALISVGYFGELKLWSLPEGALLGVLDELEGNITASALSSDRSMLATADDTGVIKIWDFPEGENSPIPRTLFEKEYTARKIAFTPDNHSLITADGIAYSVYSLTSGLEEMSIFSLCEPEMVILPDGKLLVAKDADDSIGFWRLPDGESLARLDSGLGYIHALVCSPDGSAVYASCEEGILIIDPAIMQITDRLDQGPYPAIQMTISDDGGTLATVREGSVNLWMLPEGQFLRACERQAERDILAMTFTPDGTRLITGGAYGYIHLWSVASGQFETCLVDVNDMSDSERVIQYQTYNGNGELVTITIPETALIPAGVVCVCNTVAGGSCNCVGYTSSGSGGVYWYPN